MAIASRKVLPLAAIALGAGICMAQPYPAKPVRYVVTGSPAVRPMLGR